MAIYINENQVDLTFKNLGKGIYASLKEYGCPYQIVIQKTKAEWHVYLIEDEQLYIFDKRPFYTMYAAEQFARWLHLGFTLNYVAKGDAIIAKDTQK